MSRGIKSLALFVAFVAIFTLSRHALSHNTTTTTFAAPTTTTSSAALSQTTCQGSDFTGTFNQGQGAAGTIYGSITVTKRTGNPCVIDGFPLLTLQDKTGALLPVSLTQDATGTPIQFTDAKANAAPSKLNFTVGSSTTFDLAYNDVGNGVNACPSASTINVQLKNGDSSISVTPQYPIQPCSAGHIWVSPFF